MAKYLWNSFDLNTSEWFWEMLYEMNYEGLYILILWTWFLKCILLDELNFERIYVLVKKLDKEWVTGFDLWVFRGWVSGSDTHYWYV